jgi:hypothetical protein
VKTKRILATIPLLALLSTFNLQLSTVHAQGTAFNYQGRLNSGANPAGGIYDLRFTVYDAASSGSVWGVLTNVATPVTNGLFTVTLDYGSGVFTGNARWLEIAVRTNGTSLFTTLAPRQSVTPAPYAILAGSATTASTATSVPASGIGAGTANISINGNAGTATTAAYAGLAASSSIATMALTAGTATNLIGNVSDAQLSTNIARLNGTNNFSGTNSFAGVVIATNVNNIIAGTFTGNGAALTNLNTAQFANSVLTNNQTGVTLNGAFAGNGASLTNVNAAALNGLSAMNFWQLGGNDVSGGQFLGSTNYQPVEIRVNNTRALRLEPTANDSNYSNIVNVIGGSPVNTIASGVYGSVIAGGGAANYHGNAYPNNISSDLSFLGGGFTNSIQANAYNSFLGGGSYNSIQTYAYASFLGGGNNNSIQTNANFSFLGGGGYNSIQPNAWASFLGGGQVNSIQTNAYLSFLGGGYFNTNGAPYSVVPGGDLNYAGGNNSFAAGHRAKANYAGDFVWADSQNADFASTAANQFLIRAGGGVGITGNLNVSGLTSLSSSLVMNEKDVQLRSTYDHGIGWYGSGKPFAGVNVDGPVVYGYSGGGLGIVHSGSISNIVVYWNSSGNVGIGTTSPDALLTVNGAADKPGGGSWSTFSDVRLKKNIQPLSGVLQKLLTLRGVSFEYKEPEKIHELSGERIGMIAQEVEQVFPDWVESGPAGYKRLTYRGFEALTVEALRVLRDEKDTQLQARDAEMQGLTRKVEQKETEITELKARLERLEQLVIAKNGGGQ